MYFYHTILNISYFKLLKPCTATFHKELCKPVFGKSILFHLANAPYLVSATVLEHYKGTNEIYIYKRKVNYF